MPDALPRLPEGYRPLQRLGAGGMGEVWLAEHAGGARAVKLMHLIGDAAGEQDRLRFKREFLALRRMNHPGIVRGLEWLEGTDALAYAMEFVPGTPLRDYFTGGRWHPAGGATPDYFRDSAALARLWTLAGELLDALAHLHDAGFVHRDLKPANLMVADDGRLRLIDFGLARPADDLMAITAAGEILGTPTYLPPELIRGLPPDGRADLYSFGILLYELATGAPPFRAASTAEALLAHLQQAPEPPSRRNALIPPAVATVVLRCLAKEPAARFAGAREARAALDAAARGGPDAASVTLALAAPDAAAPPGELLRVPFTGHAEALEAVRAAAGELGAGRGGTLLVSAPAGMGKSRLFDELRAAAIERGARVLRATARAGGGLAGQLFFDLFARAADDFARQPERTRAWLGDDGPALAARFPALRRFAAAATEDLAAPPAEQRARLMAALHGFVARASADQPLVLMVEDLHWADALSRDLLAHLAASFPAGAGLLLVAGNARPDDPDAAPGHDAWWSRLEARRVALGPLDAGALGALAQSALGLGGVPAPDVADRLEALTGGNPYFLLELLKAALEAGALRAGDAASLEAWAARDGGDRLPESLGAAIDRRLERLEPGLRDALAAAAILGRHFRFAHWRALTGAGEDELLDRADAALRAGLLEEEPGDRLRFAHDLIRARLLEGLSGLRARRLHARAAGALAAAGEGGLDLEIALHALAAGDDALALRHGAPALESLERDGVTAEAGVLLVKLQPVAERAPDESLALALRVRCTAIALHARDAERARVGGEVAEALELVARLPDAAARAATEFRLLRIESNALFAIGDYPGAAARVPRMVECAWDDAGRLAQVRELEAITAAMTGDVAGAAAAFEAAQAAAERIPAGRERDRVRAFVAASRAQHELDAGRLAAASELIGIAIELSRGIGARLEHAVNVANRGGLELELGRLDDAERLLREGMELSRKVGYRPVVPEILHNLARIALLRGDPAAALALAAEGADDAASRDERHYEALPRRTQMAALDALGRGAEARALEEKALALADAVGSPQLRASILLEAGLGLLEAGDHAAAAARADAALALAAGKFPESEALALALRAAAGAAGAGDSAHALALAGATGSVVLRLRVEALVARAALESGARAEARERLERVLHEAGAAGLAQLARAAERRLARFATDPLATEPPA